MFTIFFSLLLCLAGGSPVPCWLHVDLVFTGHSMPRRLEASIMKEVASIWAKYGVDVRASNACDAGEDGAVRIDVELADETTPGRPPHALGWIPFVGEVPQPAIVMYPYAIDALVADAAQISDRSAREWPTGMRDGVVARVFGRALAHEIGHFLLRSRQHSASGLMRARQPPFNLMFPERQLFLLSPEEVARLAAIATTSHQ